MKLHADNDMALCAERRATICDGCYRSPDNRKCGDWQTMFQGEPVGSECDYFVAMKGEDDE